MADLAKNLLPVMASGRALIESLGFRTNSLTVVLRTWPSGQPGVGAPTDAPTEITPKPKIRQISLREVSSSGGQYEAGDLLVTKITPYDATTYPSGYTPEVLVPPIAATDRGIERLYVVEGPLAGTYRLVEFRRDRALGYSLVLRV